MSEAPEKIWLHTDQSKMAWKESRAEGVHCYIRKDLVDDLIEALKENTRYSYSSGHAENLAYLALAALGEEQ